MGLADFSVRRAVAASMMVLVLIVLGAVSYVRIPVDILPDLSFPVAFVLIEYEGVGPEEMESTVTELAEQALSRVDGVKNLYSTSSRGASALLVEFEWGTNMDNAVVDIREKMDEIPEWMWPEEAERPRIRKFDPAAIPLLGIAVAGGGNDVHQLQTIAEDYVRDALVGVEGVAAATVFGGPQRQVLVAADQDRLSAYGLGLQDLLERLGAENYNLSAGSLKEGHKDYLVRALGEFDSPEQIGDVTLGVRDGAPIRVSDVAMVLDTYDDDRVYSRDNGERSVMMMLDKQSGANTVQVSARVWERVAEIEKQLPPGVELIKTFDTADFINEAIQNVRGNVLVGGILAILVLGLFLHHVRPVVIVAVAIPISLFTALVPMYFTNTTINMMSLGGLALATGMLVDNSIVVLENIFRRQTEEGEHRMDAARRGAREVSMAITGSTLTTIAVFIPIAFTQGYAAKLFRDLALTVTFSLAASLFTALTLVPMLASRLLSSTGNDESSALVRPLQRWGQRLRSARSSGASPRSAGVLAAAFAIVRRLVGGITMQRTQAAYRLLVRWVSKNRWKVFLLGNLFWIMSLGLAFVLEREFMPTPNDTTIMVSIELPRGTRLEETDRISGLIEDYLGRLSEILSTHSIIGVNTQTDDDQPNHASFVLTLSKQDKRERTVEQIVADIRHYVTSIPGISEFSFVNLQSQAMGAGQGKPISVKIFGKDLHRLLAVSEEAVERMSTAPGVLDAEASITYGDPEMQITFDRERAAQLGLPITMAAQLLEAAIKGKTASRFRSEGEEYDIVVRLAEKDRDSLPELEDLVFITPTGARPRLHDVAQVGYGIGPTHVYRENQKRAATIVCNRDEAYGLNEVIANIKTALRDMNLPPGYFIEYGGQFERMQETFRDLGFAALLAILLVYMIMAAQFESLVLPLAIMVSVPFAFVGSLWGLLLTGTTLSAVSGIGTILLAGIVVNNGIVLVDYTNLCRERGMDRESALIRACTTRLRPILMTNLTTILALVPMAALGGAGAELRGPLAISVMGGLTFGVILTLVLLPASYLILDSIGSTVSSAVMRRLHGNELESAPVGGVGVPSTRD